MQILVVDDEFCTLGFTLCGLHCVDELWYALCILVELLHELRNIKRVHGVKSRTKLCKVVEEFEGRDLGVEGIRVLELLVQRFFYDSHDEALAGILAVL